MKAPAFWWQEAPSFLARILQPFGSIYGAVTARRMVREGLKARQKVICIGNFTAGGVGKTPVAIAVAKLLQAQGKTVCFLSRGFGGRLAGPVLVDPQIHEAFEIGDEPLLLARHAPVIVARDRAAGLPLCEATLADIIIMDDGLQNAAVNKDISIVVVDAQTGIGNGLCIPAGPLRAPLASQWSNVSTLIAMGQGAGADAVLAEATSRNITSFRGRLVTRIGDIHPVLNHRLLAYSGIGRPAKFFDHLGALGFKLVQTRSFGDHHVLSEAEAASILRDARAANLALATTEKDIVRFDRNPVPGSALDALRHCSIAIPVHLEMEDPDAFSLWVAASIA